MTAPQTAPSKDFALQYRDMMLQSLANEVQTTKEVIAAIPDNKRDYKPDPKARTAWELAWHLATVDVQFADEIADGVFNMEPRYKDQPATIAEMASWYETQMARALERVRNLTPEQLTAILNFYDAFHFPAYVYLSFLEKHSLHHRGQLSTYLRPMGSKVPSIYGGSADEEYKPA